jgi:hypothetical protein
MTVALELERPLPVDIRRELVGGTPRDEERLV